MSSYKLRNKDYGSICKFARGNCAIGNRKEQGAPDTPGKFFKKCLSKILKRPPKY